MKPFAPLLFVLALIPLAAVAAPTPHEDIYRPLPPIVAPVLRLPQQPAPNFAPRVLPRAAQPPAAVAKAPPSLCLLQSAKPQAGAPARAATCDASQAFLDHRPADPSEPRTLQLLR